jgi:hypothetical protein
LALSSPANRSHRAKDIPLIRITATALNIELAVTLIRMSEPPAIVHAGDVLGSLALLCPVQLALRQRAMGQIRNANLNPRLCGGFRSLPFGQLR